MNTTASLTYSIGHRLEGHPGLCANFHGHNYTFEVTISGNPNEIGYVIDFKDLKAIMRELLDKLDHAMVLHVSDPLAHGIPTKLVLLSRNPSAENFASLMFNHVQDRGGPFTVTRVRVRETDGGWAEADRVDRNVTIRGERL